jgi:hypothetical protein
METREDETEIVLVEKATSPARNGEIVVGPGARPANHVCSQVATTTMTIVTADPIHPQVVVVVENCRQ